MNIENIQEWIDIVQAQEKYIKYMEDVINSEWGTSVGDMDDLKAIVDGFKYKALTKNQTPITEDELRSQGRLPG